MHDKTPVLQVRCFLLQEACAILPQLPMLEMTAPRESQIVSHTSPLHFTPFLAHTWPTSCLHQPHKESVHNHHTLC